jgi:hypothetical protein
MPTRGNGCRDESNLPKSQLFSKLLPHPIDGGQVS